MEIRGITFPFSKNKAKQLHQKESDIQNRLQVLDRVISNSPTTDRIKNEINEYNNLREEIDLIHQKKGKGSIIRSKCKSGLNKAADRFLFQPREKELQS